MRLKVFLLLLLSACSVEASGEIQTQPSISETTIQDLTISELPTTVEPTTTVPNQPEPILSPIIEILPPPTTEPIIESTISPTVTTTTTIPTPVTTEPVIEIMPPPATQATTTTTSLPNPTLPPLDNVKSQSYLDKYSTHPEVRVVYENYPEGCEGHYGSLSWPSGPQLCFNWYNTPPELQEAVVVHELFHEWAWILQIGVWQDAWSQDNLMHIEENSAECGVKLILGEDAYTNKAYSCSGERYSDEDINRVVQAILGQLE